MIMEGCHRTRTVSGADARDCFTLEKGVTAFAPMGPLGGIGWYASIFS